MVDDMPVPPVVDVPARATRERARGPGAGGRVAFHSTKAQAVARPLGLSLATLPARYETKEAALKKRRKKRRKKGGKGNAKQMKLILTHMNGSSCVPWFRCTPTFPQCTHG